MKLFVAITGDSKQDCIDRLTNAVLNDAEFSEDNGFVEHNTGGKYDYSIDFAFDESEGLAFLADLHSYET